MKEITLFFGYKVQALGEDNWLSREPTSKIDCEWFEESSAIWSE